MFIVYLYILVKITVSYKDNIFNVVTPFFIRYNELVTNNLVWIETRCRLIIRVNQTTNILTPSFKGRLLL